MIRLVDLAQMIDSGRGLVTWNFVILYKHWRLIINRLLPKCYDHNKLTKRPFSLEKLTNFTRKLSNFGTFLKLKMF